MYIVCLPTVHTYWDPCAALFQPRRRSACAPWGLPSARRQRRASDLLQVVPEHVRARGLSRGCPAFALLHNQQWDPARLSSELLYSVAEWLPHSWLVNIVTIIITIDLIFTAVYFWIFLFYVCFIICYFSKPFESLMKSENQILLPILSCERLLIKK